MVPAAQVHLRKEARMAQAGGQLRKLHQGVLQCLQLRVHVLVVQHCTGTVAGGVNDEQWGAPFGRRGEFKNKIFGNELLKLRREVVHIINGQRVCFLKPRFRTRSQWQHNGPHLDVVARSQGAEQIRELLHKGADLRGQLVKLGACSVNGEDGAVIERSSSSISNCSRVRYT